MLKHIKHIKGIHPGFVLERELRKRKLGKGRFAISVEEFPQTLVAITKGKRKMNAALSLRIEKALGLEEGYFMVLQAYHDIHCEKHKAQKQESPDLSVLRPVLFWDTPIEKIQWQRQKKAVIRRVFERGNDAEKQEIERFYGPSLVQKILKEIKLHESSL
ncbi:MAG: plasmid maintenance system antidote protein [Bacteroidetes bacterium]|nr:plasmid maintenance system antidote protein [Bacteroidota bacterium]